MSEIDWSTFDALLDDMSDADIAELAGCDESVVAKRRAALAPPEKPKRPTRKARAKAKAKAPVSPEAEAEVDAEAEEAEPLGVKVAVGRLHVPNWDGLRSATLRMGDFFSGDKADRLMDEFPEAVTPHYG